jgi:hypothetical protein
MSGANAVVGSKPTLVAPSSSTTATPASKFGRVESATTPMPVTSTATTPKPLDQSHQLTPSKPSTSSSGTTSVNFSIESEPSTPLSTSQHFNKSVSMSSAKSVHSLQTLQLATSANHNASLQTYFRTRPKFNLITRANDPSTLSTDVKPHKLTIASFTLTTKCCVCTALMSGGMRQGVLCSKCKYGCHIACVANRPAWHQVCPLAESISDEPQTEDYLHEVPPRTKCRLDKPPVELVRGLFVV